MKKLLQITAVLAALAVPAMAEEIKGEATCAKCNLKTATACQMAITVEKDGKKETYLVEQNDVAKGFHKQICTDTKKVVADGKITEKDGKKTITLAKVEEAK
jgi:hypothetical protein